MHCRMALTRFPDLSPSIPAFPPPVKGAERAGGVRRPVDADVQLRSSKLAPQLRQLTVIFPFPRGTRRYWPQLGHRK